MKDHVIICGLGHIGFRSFELLSAAGLKAAVITDKAAEDWVKIVESRGGKVILGDARSENLLLQAGIEAASSVLAVTNQDLVNVSVVMDARRMNPAVRIICRLFDTDLGRHISESFDVAQIFSTSELAAPYFIETISVASGSADRHILGKDLKGGEVVLTDEGESLFLKPAGRTKANPPFRAGHWGSFIFAPGLSKARRIAAAIVGIILLASVVVRFGMDFSWIDSLYFVTTTVTTVGYGDFNFSQASIGMKIFGILLMLTGASGLAVFFSAVAEAFLSDRLSSLFGGRPVAHQGHSIVIGGGHIGERVVDHLVKGGGSVVVIENDRVGRFPVDAKRNVAVIEGDPRNSESLRRANVGRAEAIIAVSDDDVENLSTALSAKTLNKNIRSVVRVFDADLGRKLQNKLGVDRILSVSGYAAPYFVAALFGDDIRAAARWKSQLIFLSSRPVSPKVNRLGEKGFVGHAKPLVICSVPLESS